EQRLCALLGLGVPPCGEGGRGGSNGFFCLADGGSATAADDLTIVGRIDGIEGLARVGGTVVNDGGIGARGGYFMCDRFEGPTHGLACVFSAEIDKGLVANDGFIGRRFGPGR